FPFLGRCAAKRACVQSRRRIALSAKAATCRSVSAEHQCSTTAASVRAAWRRAASISGCRTASFVAANAAAGMAATPTREADGPLRYVERNAYLETMQRTLAGVEETRVELARARQQLEYECPDARPKG